MSGAVASSDVVLRVLDGEDTIGGSKILVGWGGEGVFLDFGINYAKWGRYFEEYVKPRPAYGLGDLWKLGLVPRVQGLYRTDVIPPGLDAGSELPVRRINGVYVSHAHLDHAGLVGLLNLQIPLVCSRTTAAILKAVQDSTKSDIFAQSVYSSPYKPARVGRQDILRGDEDADYAGRDCHLTDGTGNAGFARFWEEPPTRVPAGTKRSRSKGLAPGRLATHQATAGGVHASAFTVDHSVLGSNGFLLESPQGPIAYSGDLRAHGEHADRTRRFLESLVRRPPWILLMEGTQVRERSADDEALGLPTGEEEVEQNCLTAVEKYAGHLVVADFAPRNVERLQAFLRIAKQTKRRLVILPKDAYLLHGMHAADESVPLPHDDLLVFDPPAGTEAGWEKFILDAYRDFVIHAAEIQRRQPELILCLSFWDVKHLLDLETRGGCYIYSSSEAHSEEQEIDLERLSNWLARFSLAPIGFHLRPVPGQRRPRPFFDRGYHASGHMPGDEILDWVLRIRPEHLLPVHTERRELFERRLEGTGIKLLAGGYG